MRSCEIGMYSPRAPILIMHLKFTSYWMMCFGQGMPVVANNLHRLASCIMHVIADLWIFSKFQPAPAFRQRQTKLRLGNLVNTGSSIFTRDVLILCELAIHIVPELASVAPEPASFAECLSPSGFGVYLSSAVKNEQAPLSIFCLLPRLNFPRVNRDSKMLS